MNESLRAHAPLLNSYLTYLEQNKHPFTIPGHKQNAAQLDAGLGIVVDSDVPLYGGLDEIKLTKGALKEAEAVVWPVPPYATEIGVPCHCALLITPVSILNEKVGVVTKTGGLPGTPVAGAS